MCVCVVEELLDNGVDPGCSDDKKRTALHIAAAKGHEQCGQYFLVYSGMGDC